MKPKLAATFRIGFQNINGLPIHSASKLRCINELIQDQELDFYGVQEINLNFNVLPSSEQWKHRTSNVTGYSHHAINVNTKSTVTRLFGGTACFMPTTTRHRAISHGNDPTGLGRWCWTLLEGRQGIKTRIVSAYRPASDDTNEPLTVASQHLHYFETHDVRHQQPRSAFLADLGAALQQWNDAGEQIILGMDANEDVRSNNMMQWTRDSHLVNAHTTLFPHTSAVATCNKSRQERPIDGIWTSPGLDLLDGGMSGFGEFPMDTADHRLLWIDLDPESIFGFRPSIADKRPPNFLPMRDPLAISRLNNYVLKERSRHRIPDKLLLLETKALAGTFDTTDQAIYDNIAALDLGIRSKARKKCRIFYTGNVPSSDVITRDRKEIHLWRLLIDRRNGRRTDTRKIRRLISATGCTNAMRLTISEIEEAQKKCRQKYNADKKNAADLRLQFAAKVNSRRAAKYGTTVECQEKITRHAFQQKQQNKKINRVLESKQRNPLSSVEYSNEFDERIECLSREAIEDACKREGQRRFSQSAGTPFLQGSLLRDLGYLATAETVTQILSGQYAVDDDVDEYTRKFISELVKPHNIDGTAPIDGYISTEDHIHGWKKMKTSIASSPFGPLFSDYIAGCQKVKVADIDAAMASIPILTGFCPLAWKEAVDVMIPKKAQSSDVTKLRIIVLFHALFNMVNKRVARSMLLQAETLGLIPAEIYGSRPHHQANICALNKVLTYDVLRQNHCLAALCSNDATACYDRIVHAVASLCMQRLGVCSKTCDVMLGTLQEVQHYISTAYGLSTESYGALEIKLHGIGQGNGAGPAIWLVMTIPLINMLKTQGYGFRSCTPLTGEPYTFACFTFVDDTDTIHMSSDPCATTAALLQEMQSVLDHWEGGLRATGGALSSKKSFWYLVDFTWDHRLQTWRTKRIHENPGRLTIWGGSTDRVELTRYELDHAEETLGLWIAPNGNQQQQKDVLHKKIARWGDKIRTKQLGPSDVYLSFQSRFSSALNYPLVATNLTKADCKSLMKPLLDWALPAMHIPRTFPSTLLFAPKEYLGYSLPNLWMEQNFLKIGALLQYGPRPAPDITGLLLRDIIQRRRIELGLPKSPFCYDATSWRFCVTPTNLDSVWYFCSEHNLSLLDGLPDTPLPREGDQFLMAAFERFGYSPKERRLLNNCRLFLRILFLSDLCTGNGRSLAPATITNRRPSDSHSDVQWPSNPSPDNHSWTLWREAVHRFTQPEDPLHRLVTPLGRWLVIPRGWQWFYDHSTNQVLQRLDNQIIGYRSYTTGHATRVHRFIRSLPIATLPLTALPTTIVGLSAIVRHTGTSAKALVTAEPINEWWGRIISGPTDLQALEAGIRNGTAVCVTDGSYKDPFGTAAYTIKSSINALDDFTLVNPTPGHPADADPYLAELGGLYGCVATVNRLCKQLGITYGSITIGCDCLSVLHNVFRLPAGHVKPTRAHYTMLLAARSILTASPITWKDKHIYGHQDRDNAYNNLDRWAQLNVDMDSLAKQYWGYLHERQFNWYSLPPGHGEWSLWHHSYRFPLWDKKTANRHLYTRSTSEYWNNKLQQVQSPEIDWDASGMAFKTLPLFQQLWIPKWLTSFIPYGRNIARWGGLNVCPRCGETETHRHHVLQCPSPDAITCWTTNLALLDSWMVTQSTHPLLRKAVHRMLRSWHSGHHLRLPPPTDPNFRKLFASQDPRLLVDGHLHPLWAVIQHEYYERIGRRTIGRRWAARLIRKIWEIAWAMWKDRYRVLQSPDSATLAAAHEGLDVAIQDAYEAYATSPTPPLARWFSKPRDDVLVRSLDFKHRWLEMVALVSRP